MKKFLILLLLLIIPLSGCTIDMSKDNKNTEKDNSTEKEENPPVVERVEHQGKESNKDNPLNIDEIGIASKYNAVLDAYQDVDVQITKIYDNPEEIIDEYNEENSEELKKLEGYKLVVLEYTVTLTNFETESFGTNVSLDVEVLDTSENNFVVDGIKQVINITNINDSFSVRNNESGTATIAFQIPQNINNYLIKFGTNNHTIAYYKI